MTVRVGIVGMGFMGRTHLEVYARRPDVVITAVADLDAARRTGGGTVQSNITGLGGGTVDLSGTRPYENGLDLIEDAEVELVDICLPTPAHPRFVRAAIQAGKHVLVEKPLARTAAEADEIVDLAEAAPTLAMPAMCMRFWPGWTWLKDTVDQGTHGRILGVHFQRIGAVLPGENYRNGEVSGGAILDLHVHDTDFVLHLFGMPRSVTSFGYSHLSGEIDHVLTRYDCAGPLVTAEGAWVESADFRFTLRYTAIFEKATAVYDIGAENTLLVYRPGREPEPVPLDLTPGYDHEIGYLVDCIREGRRPQKVTLRDAADAVRIVEAESRSVRSGKTEYPELTGDDMKMK